MSSIKEQFVVKYYIYAKRASEKSEIPILFALAQSALETGWGKTIKGNMMFGLKVGSGKNYGGWSGDKQLITTTEYFNTPNKKFPYTYEGYPKQVQGKWKYRVKTFFRAYPNPFFSFVDWAGLLFQNARYAQTKKYQKDPYRFAEEVVKAGYATDPNYLGKIKNIMRQIEKIIDDKGLNNSGVKILFPAVLIAISLSMITITLYKIKTG